MRKNERSRVVDIPCLTGTPVNKTTTFMLPAIHLNADKTSFKLLKYFGLINCYLKHKQGIDTNPQYLYLVFNPSMEALKNFNKFYEIYKQYPNFVRDYIVDQNVIVLVFKVKDKWLPTLEEFRKSKYSRMSKEYAELLKHKDIPSGKMTVMKEYYIIHRHQELRSKMEKELEVKIDESWELADPLDMDKEEFDYKRKE